MEHDDDDKNLFRASMINVTPLAPTQRHRPTQHKRPPKLLKQPKTLSEALILDDIVLNTDIAVPLVNATESLYFKQSGVQAKQMRALQTGDLTPQASLDLHGITLSQAEEQLALYLRRCQAREFRVVAVIHGKGHNSPDQYPALKNMTHQFLRQYPDILGFCSAPAKHGGLGATLVLLKAALKN
jgi:DNA-nicking Smr family endonuclease